MSDAARCDGAARSGATIGLTGGMGAGKSTVAARFAHHGAVVIDVDALGREVLAPGGLAEAGVRAHFGPAVEGADGAVDRAALAAVVFADGASRLAELEAISHPAINQLLDERLASTPPDALVVLDMAILVESHLGRDLPSGRGYDTVVVVEAPIDDRIARLVHGRGVDADEARRRIAAQATDAQRRAVADHVIVNDGDLAALHRQVDELVASWVP